MTDLEKKLTKLFQRMVDEARLPMDMDAVRVSGLVGEIASFIEEQGGKKK